MKKALAFFLAATLLALTACTPKQPDPQTEPQTDQTQQEQQPQTEPTQQTEPEQAQQEQQTEPEQPEPGQTPQESEPLTLTQDNVYEIVRPALQAYAQSASGYAFADELKDDEGNTKYFHIAESEYVKSAQFNTIAGLNQYFSTYLTPELYTWIDQAVTNLELIELSDGLYQKYTAHGYTAYYAQTLSLEKKDGDIYYIAVGRTTESSLSIARDVFQGIIEGNHFKITTKPEYTGTTFDINTTSELDRLPKINP